MLIAGISLANTILSICNIDLVIFSYIGGISFLTLIFIYFASYIFKFCEYHRIFLHYIVINNIINILDYYFYFDISAMRLICIHIAICCIALFTALYLKLRHDRIIKETNNK